MLQLGQEVGYPGATGALLWLAHAAVSQGAGLLLPELTGLWFHCDVFSPNHKVPDSRLFVLLAHTDPGLPAVPVEELIPCGESNEEGGSDDRLWKRDFQGAAAHSTWLVSAGINGKALADFDEDKT